MVKYWRALPLDSTIGGRVSVDIGIIGLPQSGRTTIFNALTRGGIDTGRHTPESAHIGMAKVPEPRLKGLADLLHPQKVVPATARYIDIGVSVKDLVKGKGAGGQLLAQLTNVDALLNVIRAFRDDSIPHVEGGLDVERDIANMELELAFSDLTLLERRLERLEESLKGAKPQDRQGLLREKELLLKIKNSLEKEVPIRSLEMAPEETKAISGYQFLTAKSLLVVIKIGEDLGVNMNLLKETDRIKSMLENLRKMGADIQVVSAKGPGTIGEDIVINPVNNLKGAQVKSFGDHRTAMSMIVAGLSAHGATTIDDISCISKSFPDFLKVLKSITI